MAAHLLTDALTDGEGPVALVDTGDLVCQLVLQEVLNLHDDLGAAALELLIEDLPLHHRGMASLSLGTCARCPLGGPGHSRGTR